MIVKCNKLKQAVEHQWNSILHQMYTTSNNYLNTTKWTDKLQVAFPYIRHNDNINSVKTRMRPCDYSCYCQLITIPSFCDL